jgi:hypothetical protein
MKSGDSLGIFLVDARIDACATVRRNHDGGGEAERVDNHKYVAALSGQYCTSTAPLEPAHASRIFASSHFP